MSALLAPRSRRARLAAALLLPVVALGLAACSSDSSSDTTVASADTTAAAVDTTAAAVDTTADTTVAAPADTAAASDTTGVAAGDTSAAAPVAMSAACAKDALALKTAGKLTIATDKPAYSPWFTDDDPTNGKGFESAVAYAVAETLGFPKDEVNWTVVPFDKSYAPGKKDFDFDINQISITPERAQVVDFSTGYYDVNQAVVALKDSPAATAKTIDDLKKLKFGVQVGTTSLEFVKNVVAPSAEPFVYNDTNGAKAALAAKQIDAVVVDLPTGFYISAAEIENSLVVGQFASQGGGEQFGLLMEKGSALKPCIDEAIAVLKGNGKLAAIQEAELATATNAPVFK